MKLGLISLLWSGLLGTMVAVLFFVPNRVKTVYTTLNECLQEYNCC